MRKTWATSLTAAILAAGILTGCSGGGDDEASDAPEAVVEEPQNEANGSDGGDNKPERKKDTYTDVRDPQGSVEGYVGAMNDAAVSSCDSEGDVLVATGTVTNPEDDAQEYRIYVSAMDGSDTRGIVQVDVGPLDGGATADWDAEFELDGDDLSCLLRVERFDPQD